MKVHVLHSSVRSQSQLFFEPARRVQRLTAEEGGGKESDATMGGSVARWQNLIPSFSWIAPGSRAWGLNPKKGRDQILQSSVAEP